MTTYLPENPQGLVLDESEGGIQGITLIRTTAQRKISQVPLKRVFMETPGVAAAIEKCRVSKGTTYPPQGVNDLFSSAISRMKIARSEIQGKGTFADTRFRKGELFGFYEGDICHGTLQRSGCQER